MNAQVERFWQPGYRTSITLSRGGRRWHKFLFLHLEPKGRIAIPINNLNNSTKNVLFQYFWQKQQSPSSGQSKGHVLHFESLMEIKCHWFIFDQNSFLWIWYVCRLFTMLPVLLNLPQIGLFTMSEGGLTCSYLQINLGKHNRQYQQSSHQY